MFVSYQHFFAVPLVVYEHVYEVSSLYYIGKLGFQNPCFSTDSREIEYIYIYRVYIGDALGCKLKEECSPKLYKIQTSPTPHLEEKRLNCALG